MVGDLHRHSATGRVAPMPDNALPNRHDGARGTNPAHHRFVPDTHAHNVVARKFSVLAPMLLGAAVWITPGSSNACIDRDQLANISAGDHCDDGAVEGQRMGCGDDLSRERRMPT